MSSNFEKTQDVFNDINMWFKINQNQNITLADIPELIKLRWSYFRDNWNLVVKQYTSYIPTYIDSDALARDIVNFTEFVNSQRTASSKKNPFESSDTLFKFYTIFDNTPINSIGLSLEEINVVNSKIRRIRAFTRKEFVDMRSRLQEERDAIADRASASDEDYNKIFNRSSQAARVDIGNKDINDMYMVQQTIKSIDFILSNSFSLNSVVNPFALARANANNDSVAIGDYLSGSLVRLNYGENLQALAKRTLGDPNKWIDIAIANGLKAPYIDEIGERIYIISNASGNQINIPQTSNQSFNLDKLFIGQVLLLKSNVQSFPEQRNIVAIKEIPVSGEIIIELSGEPDLDKYKLIDQAYIRIYKPNTVNSSFYVLIPSTEPITDVQSKETPWFLKADDAVAKKQKVDISINDDGDIVLGSTSDVQLSYSFDNSIQAIRLKLLVEQGELIRHDTFGLPPVAGSTNNNVDDIRSFLATSIERSINDDSRFSGIQDMNISYTNSQDSLSSGYFSITMSVRLAGTDSLVPISFTVNT